MGDRISRQDIIMLGYWKKETGWNRSTCSKI